MSALSSHLFALPRTHFPYVQWNVRRRSNAISLKYLSTILNSFDCFAHTLHVSFRSKRKFSSFSQFRFARAEIARCRFISLCSFILYFLLVKVFLSRDSFSSSAATSAAMTSLFKVIWPSSPFSRSLTYLHSRNSSREHHQGGRHLRRI